MTFLAFYFAILCIVLIRQRRALVRSADAWKESSHDRWRWYQDQVKITCEVCSEREGWRRKFDHSENANAKLMLHVTALELRLARVKKRKKVKR